MLGLVFKSITRPPKKNIVNHASNRIIFSSTSNWFAKIWVHTSQGLFITVLSILIVPAQLGINKYVTSCKYVVDLSK